MKNDIQEKIYEEIKDLHGNELIDYLKGRVAQSSFADWWQSSDSPNDRSRNKVA